MNLAECASCLGDRLRQRPLPPRIQLHFQRTTSKPICHHNRTHKHTLRAHAQSLDAEFPYAENLQPYDPDFDDGEGDSSFADRARVYQIELMERYGLKVGTLVSKETETDADLADWDEELSGDALSGSRLGDEPQGEEELEAELAEDFSDVQEDDERFYRAQMDFHFQTTTTFGEVVERLSDVDDMSLNNADSIPLWIRAHFVFEEEFDNFNEQIRQNVIAQDALPKDPYTPQQIQQIRDWVVFDEEMMEEFDVSRYQRLMGGMQPAQQESLETSEPVELGVGDDLDSLLTVLPGVERDEETEGYVDDMYSQLDAVPVIEEISLREGFHRDTIDASASSLDEDPDAARGSFDSIKSATEAGANWMTFGAADDELAVGMTGTHAYDETSQDVMETSTPELTGDADRYVSGSTTDMDTGVGVSMTEMLADHDITQNIVDYMSSIDQPAIQDGPASSVEVEGDGHISTAEMLADDDFLVVEGSKEVEPEVGERRIGVASDSLDEESDVGVSDIEMMDGDNEIRFPEDFDADV